MEQTVSLKKQKISQTQVVPQQQDIMSKIKENSLMSKRSGRRQSSQKIIIKPPKSKSTIGAFFSDDYHCDECDKEYKTEKGVFFCQKCDYHKCQNCVKKECHEDHHHSVIPRCKENHVLRFINSHAHDRLFASDKNKIKSIYFKDGSYQCDISNMDDCHSCSKLKLENLICKQFSCPQSHSMDIFQNAVDGATCDFCLVNFEDQVIGSCEKCQFQICENCLSFLDQMNLTGAQKDFIMVYINKHIAQIREEKRKFINSENQSTFKLDLNLDEVNEILNQFKDSLDENFENLNFSDEQESEITEKLKNMLEKKPFKEAHFCPKNHKLNQINDQKFTCCFCKKQQNCYSCEECADFKMCIECVLQIENIQIPDFKKSFFMKIFENISKNAQKHVIGLKEICNLNLTQFEVQKVVNKLILYLNQQIVKIKQKNDELKSYMFYQRDAEELICKQDHRMTKKPCDRDKICTFCHAEREKFTIFHSCRSCQLDLCGQCVDVIDSFQLTEEQQPYVIQLFHKTILNAFESKSQTYCCQIQEDDLEDLDISKEQLNQILIGMQNCFQGQEQFRCDKNHPLSREKLQKITNKRCQICKKWKQIDTEKDRFLECTECDFDVCDNKCLTLLEILQIDEDKKQSLMERFVQILKNENTLSCDYKQIKKNDPDKYFIEKMKLFLEVQNNIEDDEPQFCSKNHQLLKNKLEDKSLQCIICNQNIQQNKQKNIYCYQCNECTDFLICDAGCKLQIDQLQIQDDLKHIFMDIFQNLLPINQTDKSETKTPEDDNQIEENQTETNDKDEQQPKQYKIKQNLNDEYLQIKNEIVEQNQSVLEIIQYEHIINQMEHYITDFKCQKTGHIFTQQDDKPQNHVTKCENCELLIDDIQEESKGYQKCAECEIPNCNSCYKLQLVKLCDNNHTFAGSGDKCLQCSNTIQKSKYHQCIKCSYFKCSKCLNKHKYITKYFIPDQQEQNDPDEDDQTLDFFQKGLNIMKNKAFDKANQQMVDKKTFKCCKCDTQDFEDDDHCYECEDCYIRTCFKCANIDEEVIGVPSQIEHKYSDTGVPNGVTSDKELITVDLTFVTVNVIYVLFLLLQSSCIASYLGFYEIYMNNQCNKSMYVVPEILKDYFNYPIPKENVFYLCTALAVFLKFASAEYLRLMLLSYLKLEKNQTFFVVTLFCVCAPSCLMVPFYTYDHDLCIQKNFMMDITFSCVVQIICVTITAAIMALGLLYITSCMILGFLDNFEIHNENTDHFSIINKLPFASLVLDLLEKTNKSSNPYIRLFIGKIAAYFKKFLVEYELKKMKALQQKIQKEINLKKKQMMQDINKIQIKQNIQYRIEFDELFNEKDAKEDFENFIKKMKEKKAHKSGESSDDEDLEQQKSWKYFCVILAKDLPTKEETIIIFSDWFGYDNTLKGWKKLNNVIKIVLKQLLISSSFCFALCMLVIQLCTYQLFQGQILATGGNNEFMSLLKLFTYFWVFSQKDQLAFIERLRKDLVKQALRLLGKELQFVFKMLNSNLCSNIIGNKLREVVGEDFKFDEIYNTLNPILEEADKESKKLQAEDEQRAKEKEEAKAKAKEEALQILKDKLIALKKKKPSWGMFSQKLQKQDEDLNMKKPSWGMFSQKLQKKDEDQNMKKPSWGMFSQKNQKKDEDKNKIKPSWGMLSLKQNKKQVQPENIQENEELKEGGEPERRSSIYLSKILNQIDPDDSDDEDLKKYCCFKTKKSRKRYKKFCQFFKDIFSFLYKKAKEDKPMLDSELQSIKNEFLLKQQEIENEFKAKIIEMIKNFISDVKDELPDNATKFIKRFMSEVIFNKYTPQKFNLKLTNIVEVVKNFDPVEKAKSYFIEQFQQGNIEFVNKFIRSTQIQELFQKYSQQILIGQLQNHAQLIDLVCSFLKIIEPQAVKFEKFISAEEIKNVNEWIQEVQYQVQLKGNNGQTEEGQKLTELFLSKINNKGYEFIELYQDVVFKYMNDLLEKLQNFSKFKIQNFLKKNDEEEIPQDHDPSQDSLIKQQVKEFKNYLEISPIQNIIKDLINSGGLEMAKDLIMLFVNQDNFATSLLSSISDNKDLINQLADSAGEVREILKEGGEGEQQQDEEEEERKKKEITKKLRENSIIQAKKIIENKLRFEKRKGKLIFKDEYVDEFLDKLENLKDIQNLEYTLKYELQKMIINQALSPKTIESQFDIDPECIQVQIIQIKQFYELYLKGQTFKQSNQQFEDQLKEEDITEFLRKDKTDLQQHEINDLLNKLKNFFAKLKLDQIYYDFESNFKYRVYQYQARVIQEQSEDASKLIIVKSITLKKISDNIWIECKDYKDTIIDQMYNIILSKTYKKEQDKEEEKDEEEENQEADAQIQDDEGPPDSKQQDVEEQQKLDEQQKKTQNASSIVLNAFKAQFGKIFASKNQVEIEQQLIIEPSQPNDDSQINLKISASIEQKKDEEAAEQTALINKNVEPSDNQIPEIKDEDPADSNLQEQIESKDDIFDSIENQKLKEYIDKMEIQQLIEYMEQILQELKMEEVSGFIIDYLKESGVSFFKKFISDQLHAFMSGDFSGDGVKDLLQSQENLFNDYGNDFSDIINNPEKIENSLLHCLETYVVNPLSNWISDKIPQIQQYITEQVWPKIVRVFQTYVYNFFKKIGDWIWSRLKKIGNKILNKLPQSLQTIIRGWIEEHQQEIEDQIQERLSLVQDEVNQGIGRIREGISDQENSVSPLVQ